MDNRSKSSLDSLLAALKKQMSAVEHLMDTAIRKTPHALRILLRHSLRAGKRIRPALILLTADVFGRRTTSFHALAAAVELLHSATLIHDDVIDRALSRRGHTAVHRLLSLRGSILAGDYLMAQSVALVTELNNTRILRILARALAVVCSGEICQMFVPWETRVHRKEYYQSCEAKTAALFSASTEMAAILARAKTSHVTSLRRYGYECGMAFQIVDDILDFVGDEQMTGKPIGNDLRNGVLTLPTIYYLEHVKGATAVRAVLSGVKDVRYIRKAITEVRTSGAIEASYRAARRHVQCAHKALAGLPDNPASSTLHRIADFILERRF